MDQFESSIVSRAAAALNLLHQPQTNRHQAKTFTEIAAAMCATGTKGNLSAVLAAHPSANVKAVASSLDTGWGGTDAESLAASFIASIAQFSLLDQCALFAKLIPGRQPSVMIASGVTAGPALAELAPKVVRTLSVATDPVEHVKVAAMIVATKELLTATADAGLKLFQRELETSVVAASNTAFLDSLTDSGTIAVGTTGDVLNDLRAGLRASEASHGYVVACAGGMVADLATRSEALPGFSVRGGAFRPGLWVSAVDDFTGLQIIPASRLALFVGPLSIRPSNHASVNMSDSPTSPSELVNLWQVGCSALLAERSFHLVSGAPCVKVA